MVWNVSETGTTLILILNIKLVFKIYRVRFQLSPLILIQITKMSVNNMTNLLKTGAEPTSETACT
jgi:hypothetical protein